MLPIPRNLVPLGRLTRRPFFRGRTPQIAEPKVPPATKAASSLTADRMVKSEKPDCCHTHHSRLLPAMEPQERNLNVAQLRKCARYFRALAAVPETTAAARAELVRAAVQFEALALGRIAVSTNDHVPAA